MPPKSRARALSAIRKRRQRNRRSSLNDDPQTSENIPPLLLQPNTFYSEIDLRTIKEKIASLEDRMNVLENNSTFDEYLDSLVLMQLYTSLEYGGISMENARACLNLSKFYLDRRNLLPQAKTHILQARQIFEQLNIQPNDDHLAQNLLGFEIYLLLIKCSFLAKRYSSQRDLKIKNRHILSIDTTHIEHDICKMENYLEKIKELQDSEHFHERLMECLLIQFDILVHNLKTYNSNIINLVGRVIETMDKYPSNDQIKRKIDIYLRTGSYLINFNDTVSDGLSYYTKAVKLAEDQEEQGSSDVHKYQLANAFLQWGKAKVKVGRLSDNTERKFQRALELFRQSNTDHSKDALSLIDELAAFYTKKGKFQDAVDILCDSLPDKRQLFGEFSDEVIQTESHIGAIYLRECEYINAAEHLKECFDLQEFVYGSKDPRTCQTRNALDLLKKNPQVSRQFFSRTSDGIREDRPAFRLSKKVSHEKEDHELLLTATKKPPISSKN